MLRQWYQKYERWMPALFFVLGFAFDAIMLRRIDELLTIVQQGSYLALSGALIGLGILERHGAFRPPRIFGWAWRYREAVLHFVMGTLLNGYTIFYFKSASLPVAFAFLIFLVAVLLANEFWHVSEERQVGIRIALLSLCSVSYFIYLVPILLGRIGVLAFLAALLVSCGAMGLLFWLLWSRLKSLRELLEREVVLPFLLIHLVIGALYFAKAIPPVPLSLSYAGIFHDIRKEEGQYLLTSLQKPPWIFWERGDQRFWARPGDALYLFIRVFCPTRLRDQLFVRWYFHQGKLGWKPTDAIPIPVSGGRSQGYRGFTVKKHFEPGDWRVQIETSDGRELGRLGVTVLADDSTGPRLTETEVQ